MFSFTRDSFSVLRDSFSVMYVSNLGKTAVATCSGKNTEPCYRPGRAQRRHLPVRGQVRPGAGGILGDAAKPAGLGEQRPDKDQISHLRHRGGQYQGGETPA